MSFYRLIFYHAMLGGWAAFIGWFISELVLLRRRSGGDLDALPIAITTALVGAAIGGGIALLGALANGRLQGYLARFGFCLAGGFVGGALGGYIGNLVTGSENVNQFLFVVLLIIGWMIVGMCIGGIEGIFDRSLKKIRNGIIGGAIGGLLGSLCFVLVAKNVSGNMPGRAIGFVILGASIGLFIGLAQIILREAWLTVEQGFRPGRQFVLNVPVTILGTSEKSQLPFIAFGAKGVEPIHLRIERQRDGAFVVRDNGSRTGTFINGERAQEETLQDGDMIQLGPNVVRFREVMRHVTSEREAQRKRPPPLPEATPIRAAKPPPVPGATSIRAAKPQPLPDATPIRAGLPPAKPTVSAAATAPLPAYLQPAVMAAQPAKPAAASGPRGQPCPKCAKPGTPIPGTGKHLCMSCDLKY
jgi:pSer/pThr/pTyr-binding forkhead associated (FHA) protein